MTSFFPLKFIKPFKIIIIDSAVATGRTKDLYYFALHCYHSFFRRIDCYICVLSLIAYLTISSLHVYQFSDSIKCNMQNMFWFLIPCNSLRKMKKYFLFCTRPTLNILTQFYIDTTNLEIVAKNITIFLNDPFESYHNFIQLS